MKIRHWCVIVLLAWFGYQALAETPALRIAVVSGDGLRGYAPGIEALLEKHGVAVTVVPWEADSKLPLDNIDLVIVTGPGNRAADAALIGKDFPTPVLGYGAYGSRYFGQFDLKHGEPYT